jgi:hypothetical protein
VVDDEWRAETLDDDEIELAPTQLLSADDAEAMLSGARRAAPCRAVLRAREIHRQLMCARRGLGEGRRRRKPLG